MAARKMVQPGEFTQPPKNPPPPKLIEFLDATFALHDMDWRVMVSLDGVLLKFNQQTELVLMTSRGARKLAQKLLAKADELDVKLAKEKSSNG